MTLKFTGDDIEKDDSLCKLGDNVKHRTAVAGSVGFLNLSRNYLKEKSVTL